MRPASRAKDATSQRYVNAWLEQHDGAVWIGHAQDQHLRADRTDLSRWKVEYRDHQAPAEFFRTVMNRELSAGAADAKRPEIDAQLVGRLAGFGKRLGLKDAADAHVDALEIGNVDRRVLAQHCLV